MEKSYDSLYKTLLYAFAVVPLTVFLLIVVYESRNWAYEHDAPLLMYMAFLMDRFGALPYRDFFDMNLPGTYFAYLFIARVFGYDDFGVRGADLLVLAGLGLTSLVMLRRFGIHVAWLAFVFFALLYLKSGPRMMLQREYLALLPILLGTTLVMEERIRSLALRAALSGLCIGIATTVKPHMAIVLPLFWCFVVAESRARSQNGDGAEVSGVKTLVLGGAGFAVPLSALLAYLVYHGIVGEFLEILTQYVPLYGSLTATHETISGTERLVYLVDKYLKLGNLNYLLVAAVAGYMLAFSKFEDRSRNFRRVALLVALTFAFSLYPVFSGQFWSYHYLPFRYFLAVGMALCFLTPTSKKQLVMNALATLTCVIALFTVLPPHHKFGGFIRKPPEIGEEGAAVRIAAFLNENLKDGDKVQPIDWTGGGVIHGMLMARAQIATPFIYHFHFYHHVSSDYIQGLRKRYMQSIREARPRFVIEGLNHREGYVRGPDTSRSFPESEQFIKENYTIILKDKSFQIWERTRIGATVTRQNVER